MSFYKEKVLRKDIFRSIKDDFQRCSSGIATKVKHSYAYGIAFLENPRVKEVVEDIFQNKR